MNADNNKQLYNRAKKAEKERKEQKQEINLFRNCLAYWKPKVIDPLSRGQTVIVNTVSNTVSDTINRIVGEK